MGEKKPYQECRLPDGTEVYCLNPLETKYIYQEVQAYLEKGIQLPRNAVVFDVGANIGLFTITALKATGGTAEVFAFEPVPEICEVLRANTEGMDSDRVRVFPFGLGREVADVKFSYYPGMPVMSRLSPGWSEEELAGLRESYREHLEASMRRKEAFRKSKMFMLLPAFLRRRMFDRKFRRMFRERVIESRLETMRKVIAEEEVERIDLLKIDVEGAELDVLLGMGEEDWRKVEQAVIEVHDIDGRLDTIRELLERHGVSEIEVDRDANPLASGVCMIYARRTGEA